MKKVAILIFDNVEVLDFAGPFEVFSVSRTPKGEKLYDVSLIAEKEELIRARNNFLVQPNLTTDSREKFDMVVVPGGYGTRPLLQNEKIKAWIKTQFEEVELMLSVCTGSLVLGSAGLLDDLSATTHHMAFDELKAVAPNTEIIQLVKYVDNGKVITAAGISAGIEMALHVVERHHGKEQAELTARYMEYTWNEA